ncbi:tRNA-His guanylyltransferase, partial [Tulasnella sp. 331]
CALMGNHFIGETVNIIEPVPYDPKWAFLLRFTDIHGFEKPNDLAALELMDEAAKAVMKAYPGDVALAFGESDEYRRTCTLFSRRESKILTSVVSTFTSAYVFNWPKFILNKPLQSLPTFDGRLVVYPREKDVRDYFAWRQADTHINNLYNTTFWALIQKGGMSTAEAHKRLQGTYSNDKNEILYSQFNINYAHLPERYRKGSVLVWKQSTHITLPDGKDSTEQSRSEVRESAETDNSIGGEESTDLSCNEVALCGTERDEATSDDAERVARKRLKKQQKKQERQLKKEVEVVVRHCDIIKDVFWVKNEKILS